MESEQVGKNAPSVGTPRTFHDFGNYDEILPGKYSRDRGDRSGTGYRKFSHAESVHGNLYNSVFGLRGKHNGS